MTFILRNSGTQNPDEFKEFQNNHVFLHMRINLEKYSLKTMVRVGERQGEMNKIKKIFKSS